MKKIIFFLALTCIFMASCNEDLFTEDLDYQSKLNLLEKTSDPFLNGKAITRDLKIHKSIGTITVGPSSECDAPYSYKVLIVGTGNATFLGNYNLEMWFCLNPLNGDNLDCYGVVTAANGDKFYTLMTDSNHNQGPDWWGKFMINPLGMPSGTGRFSEATGEFETAGLFSVEQGVFDLVGEGEITY
jgi:hypothetical protein